MPLKGSIKDFQLEEIINFIDAGKKTGALEIQNGPEVVVFYFKKGSIYFIHKNTKPVSLTEKILNSGLIEKDVADKIKSGKIFPPETLSLDEETKKKVAQLVFDTLVELAADVFVWSDGTFVFKNNEKRTGEDWGIYIDTARFLEKVRKHSEVFKRFSEHARTLKTRLELNHNLDNDEDIIISGKEWKFLSHIRPGMTIEEVANSSGFSFLSAITIATNLIEKGLILPTNSVKEEPETTTEGRSLESEREVVEKIKKEAEQEEEVTVQPETEAEEALDEDSLIDELAAITGSVEASDDTRHELENILKTLKELQ